MSKKFGKNSLDARMKEFYENVPKQKLVRRVPVIIRIDGKSFHTFTRKLKRPFDDLLIRTMQETTKYLCENIQGCTLGYCQSDEISLLLTDYETLDTSAWFDYKVEKLVSVSASMATKAFNSNLMKNVYIESAGISDETFLNMLMFGKDRESKDINEDLKAYLLAIYTGAEFDSRAFNIPREEVTNYFYWRQSDASRNSVSMVGHTYFSNSEMKNKSVSEVQDMLMEKHNINWNNYETHKKRGTCVVRQLNEGNTRPRWVIDKEIPIFKGDGRSYVEKCVDVDKEIKA